MAPTSGIVGYDDGRLSSRRGVRGGAADSPFKGERLDLVTMFFFTVDMVADMKCWFGGLSLPVLAAGPHNPPDFLVGVEGAGDGIAM